MKDTAVIRVFASNTKREIVGYTTINVTGDNSAERRRAALFYAQDKWPQAAGWQAKEEILSARVAGCSIEYNSQTLARPEGWSEL